MISAVVVRALVAGLGLAICAVSVAQETAFTDEATFTEPGPQRLVWNHAPVALNLVVGAETRLQFPAAIGWYDIKIPPELADRLTVQTVDNVSYFKANDAFAAGRLHVQAQEGTAYYLIDVMATKDGPRIPQVEFVDATLQSGSISSGSPVEPGVDDTVVAGPAVPWVAPESAEPAEIRFTRFIATQIYGPSRLAKPLAGARRIAMGLPKSVPLVSTASITAEPVAAWRYGDLYGIAIRLINTTDQDQVIDPREFRCDCVASTTQHSLLLPANGNSTDETTTYLITRVSPAEALGYAVDAVADRSRP